MFTLTFFILFMIFEVIFIVVGICHELKFCNWSSTFLSINFL